MLDSEKAEYIGQKRPCQELLDQAFEKTKTGVLFIWTSCCCTLPEYDTAGSYKYISKEDLVGREFQFRNVNGKIALHFVDIVYDPVLKKTVRIPE